MRQVKAGEYFFPTINTGGYRESSKLSMKVIDENENEVSFGGGSFSELTKPIEDHSGTTDGVASAGSKTITLASGNTLEAGDLIIVDDTAYRITDASDTSITVDKALVDDIDADTDLSNTGDTTSYSVSCKIDTAVGAVNVIISHPEMDDTVLKYEVVNKTLQEHIAESSNTRRMVAVV